VDPLHAIADILHRRTRLDTRRFGSAENKPDAMVSSTSGLIRVASTNQTIMSSQKLSILCFERGLLADVGSLKGKEITVLRST
jgi:hypothetical protein